MNVMSLFDSKSKKIERRNHFIALSGIAVLFLLFTLPSLNDPYVLDEVQFIKTAEGVAATGKPVFITTGGEETYGLWSPPLYVYILGGIFKIMGSEVVWARLLSVLFTIASAVLLYLLAQKISPKKYRKLIPTVAVALHALMPFVVQSALLIDIDGSILTFVMLLFLYYWLDDPAMKSRRQVVLLTALLTLIVCTKLQGWILIVATMGAYFFLQRQWKQLFLSAGMAIISLLGYLAAWALLAAIVGLPFLQPFIHLFQLGFDEPTGASSILKQMFTVLWGAKNIVYWITPPLAFLFLVLLWQRITEYWKKKTCQSIDILVLHVGITTVLYTLFKQSAYGFPKYYITMAPVLCLCLALWIVPHLSQVKIKKWHLYVGGLGLAVYCTSILNDPFIDHNFFYHGAFTIAEHLSLYISTTLLGVTMYVLPVVILTALIWYRTKKFLPSVIGISLLCFVVFSLHLNIVQSDPSYTTRYYYGQTGQWETVEYIKNNTASDEILVMRNDLAYHTDRFYYFAFAYFENTISQTPDKVILSPKDNIRPYDSTSFDLAGQTYHLTGSIGHFKIYEPLT